MTDPTTPRTIPDELQDLRAFVAMARGRCMAALLAVEEQRAETWGWLARCAQDRIAELAAQLAAARAMDEARQAVARYGA